MEQLTHEQSIELAALTGHHGYQLLIRYLKGYEEIVREDLVRKKTPGESLRHLRFWQFLTQIVSVLERTPQSVLESLERLKQENPTEEYLDYEDPIWKYRLPAKIDNEDTQ